jgi:hypothetical protein
MAEPEPLVNALLDHREQLESSLAGQQIPA